MIVGSLIRLENDPTGGRLSPHGPHRRRQDPGIVPPDPEENWTGRVRRDDDSVAHIIEVVECGRKLIVERAHGGRDNRAPRPPTGTSSIGKHFVGAISRSPRTRRERSDDSPAVLVLPYDSRGRNRSKRLLLRHDGSNRLPV